MKIRVLFWITTVSIFSCTKETFFDQEIISVDPFVNFDYLWQDCNDRYTYFELKGIDWDAKREENRGYLSADMSQDSLFRVLGDMLNELQDGHVNLQSHFNVSFYPFQRLGQDNFDFRLIQEHYLPIDYYISGPFVHDYVAPDIAYVRYSSFQNNIEDVHLDFVLDRYQGSKGLILDLRENGGGSSSNIMKILSRFVEEKTTIYRQRYKTGPAPDAFSDLKDIAVSPYDGLRYTGPVIVLVDRGSYSASSILALGTKAISNIILVGDTSGGGLGTPIGGQLPNAWTYRFSANQKLDLEGNDYENGVPVEVNVHMDWSDRSTDEILEAAVNIILDR